MPPELNNGNIPGLPGQPEGLLNPQEAAEAEALREREVEPIEYLEMTTDGLVKKLEKAEGARDIESALQWPISTHLQQIIVQGVNMEQKIGTLKNYCKAKEVTGEPGWYTKAPGSYGFETSSVRVLKEVKDEKGKPIKVFDHFENRVRLGDDTERKGRVERIEKFTRETFARMKFSGLYGHLFKHSIESISNLATLYLASVDIQPEDLNALLTLPADPEDFNRDTPLESKGKIIYDEKDAKGKMMITAMQIFNAVGLSEKPRLFNEFVKNNGWSTNVMKIEATANGAATPARQGPPALNGARGPVFENAIFKEWFGDPRLWMDEVNNDSLWYGQPVNTLRTEKTWKEEAEGGKRGNLTKWGNVFVHEDGFKVPREFRKEVTKFLGGSKTAEEAVNLAWKYFRLFASADFVGSEWYYYPDQGTIHSSIPLGSDYTSDFGKAVHPAEYLEFYHKNSRGAVPRGEYGKIKPLAVDVLRGTTFGENYEDANGNRLGEMKRNPNGSIKRDVDGKVETERVSLYDLLFVYGIKPEDIHYDCLPERALQSPYLRFFMSSCGREYGNGSFDIMTDKIDRPEPYLEPAFWEKLKSKLHVGITKENVRWNNFMKSNGTDFHMPSSGEVDTYRLEMIRVMLDGIFAEPISVTWDKEATAGGDQKLFSLNEREGVAKLESDGTYTCQKIIDIANDAIDGLDYPSERLRTVRLANEIDVY